MRTLYILLSLLAFECHAKSFLESCLKPKTKVLTEHFTELKKQLHAKNCFSLKKKIAAFTSLAEIISPTFTRFESANRKSWTQLFPYMYGLMDKERKNFETFTTHPLLFSENIDVFSEFPNIFHLTYSPEYDLAKHNTLCELLKKLPNIKQITTTTKELLKGSSDKCAFKKGVEVLIRDPFKGVEKRLESKIVGFEDFQDKFINLKNFPHLKYLKVSEYNESQGSINILSNKINLTHLSLNINDIQDIEFISKLSNLSFLSLYCQQSSWDDGPLKGCKNRELRDVEFIARLQWLEYLDLSLNRINNVSSIVKLQNLKQLRLSYNNLTTFPDIAAFKKLEELYLDGTHIESLEISKPHFNLKNLSLRGVPLKTQINFLNLPRLEFLDLAETQIFYKNANFILPKSLKILDVSGDGNRKPRDVQGSLSALLKTDVFKSNPKPLYELFNHVPYDSYSLDVPTFSNSYSLDLPDLEVFIASNNHLLVFPDISKLPNLKILKLEFNHIQQLPNELAHRQLTSIDLTGNKFHKFPNLEKLTQLGIIDLINNDIFDLENIAYLPRPVRVGLAENKITRFPLFTGTEYQYSFFELDGNPLISGHADCPEDSINDSVRKFCKIDSQ